MITIYLVTWRDANILAREKFFNIDEAILKYRILDASPTAKDVRLSKLNPGGITND